MKKSYPILEMHVALRDRDLALGLLYQAGLTTVLTTRRRAGLILEAQLASNDKKALSRLRAAERRIPKKVFRLLRQRQVARGPWADHYQKFLKPFEMLPAAGGSLPLRIDPRGRLPRRIRTDTLYIKASLAFGTGAHPTTQLAAEFLRNHL